MEQKIIEIYPISIESMEEGGYFAECPILQGCHAEGETFAEAIANIQDVIRAHVECRRKHGEIVPFVLVKKQQDLSINFPLPVSVLQHV